MAHDFDTLVFCTSYIADEDGWNGRYRRWLAHHAALPWDRALLCMVDDGSPWLPDPSLIQVVGAGDALPERPMLPILLRFPDRLGRASLHEYPGWWRSFLQSLAVARHYGCSRIVHVESDAYVLSRRMLDFVQARQSGWTVFWCPRWNFAETAVQVICQDSFGAMQAVLDGGWQRHAGLPAERVLPFTGIVREPHGNRYGEFRSSIPGYADFAVQVDQRHKVWFR